MSLQHQRKITVIVGGRAPIDAINEFSGDGGSEIDATIPAAATDHTISVAIDVSQVKSCVMLADQTLAVMVNSLGGSGGGITLLPDLPYIWDNESGYNDFKFTTDVTSLHVISNDTSPDDAELIIDIAYDSTLNP